MNLNEVIQNRWKQVPRIEVSSFETLTSLAGFIASKTGTPEALVEEELVKIFRTNAGDHKLLHNYLLGTPGARGLDISPPEDDGLRGF